MRSLTAKRREKRTVLSVRIALCDPDGGRAFGLRTYLFPKTVFSENGGRRFFISSIMRLFHQADVLLFPPRRRVAVSAAPTLCCFRRAIVRFIFSPHVIILKNFRAFAHALFVGLYPSIFSADPKAANRVFSPILRRSGLYGKLSISTKSHGKLSGLLRKLIFPQLFL